MGKHAGPSTRRSRASTGDSADRSRPLLLTLGVTATLVAWGFLVRAAIDFGGQARAGASTAWAFTALATLGAACCLFVTLILAGRLVDAFRTPALTVEPRVVVPPGGRRARR